MTWKLGTKSSIWLASQLFLLIKKNNTKLISAYYSIFLINVYTCSKRLCLFENFYAYSKHLHLFETFTPIRNIYICSKRLHLLYPFTSVQNVTFTPLPETFTSVQNVTFTPIRDVYFCLKRNVHPLSKTFTSVWDLYVYYYSKCLSNWFSKKKISFYHLYYKARHNSWLNYNVIIIKYN